MIIVENDVKPGDLVYAWYSLAPEKDPKKRREAEYRFDSFPKDGFKLHSLEGNYYMVFSGELIGSWFGGVRRAK